MIQNIQRPDGQFHIRRRIAMLRNRAKHRARVMHIHIIIHNDHALRPRHLSCAPDGVHQSPPLQRILLLHLQHCAVVKTPKQRQVVINHIRHDRLEQGQEQPLHGLAHEVILLRRKSNHRRRKHRLLAHRDRGHLNNRIPIRKRIEPRVIAERPFKERARPKLARNALAHAVFTLPFSLAHIVGMVALRKLAYAQAGGSYAFGNWPTELVYEYLKDFRSYATLLAIVYLYRFILRRLQGEAEFLSDSLAWFARVAELARRTVSAGRITPVITNEGPFTVARWKPVTTESIEATIALLAASMPPICTAGSGVDAGAIYTQLVDGIARSFLFQYGWKADLGRQRKPEVQALRAMFGALAKPDHVVRGGTDEFDDALRQLRDELDRHQRRLAGEPVVLPRVRLVISDDPGDPWIVRLELVDDRDSARWCTANDVWDANDTAIEVAKGAQHLDRLRELIGATVEQVRTIPGLADLALEHEQRAG